MIQPMKRSRVLLIEKPAGRTSTRRTQGGSRKKCAGSTPDGTVENKAQAIADLKSGDLKLQSASLDGAKVQVYGDTAVVTYSSNDKGTYKGKDISGKTRWTDVFVNHNGRWQVVASHG